MIDRKTNPLELASRVLEPETIREIKLCPGFGRCAYLILDRWALNEPEALKRLEMSGKTTMRLMNRLYDQDAREEQALCSDEGIQMSMSGMSNWEILEIMGVDTRLETTA